MICTRCKGHGFALATWFPPRYQWCADCVGMGEVAHYAGWVAPDLTEWTLFASEELDEVSP